MLEVSTVDKKFVRSSWEMCKKCVRSLKEVFNTFGKMFVRSFKDVHNKVARRLSIIDKKLVKNLMNICKKFERYLHEDQLDFTTSL